MPWLVVLESSHYAPKDGNDAIQEILIANDADQALAYIDKEHLYDYFADEDHSDKEEESGYFSPTKEWWDANPSKRDEAVSLGLEIVEYSHDITPSVRGTGDALTRWLQSNTWKDVEDAYYGVTQFTWQRQQSISDEDAATLLRLSLAKDIRGWKAK